MVCLFLFFPNYNPYVFNQSWNTTINREQGGRAKKVKERKQRKRRMEVWDVGVKLGHSRCHTSCPNACGGETCTSASAYTKKDWWWKTFSVCDAFALIGSSLKLETCGEGCLWCPPSVKWLPVEPFYCNLCCFPSFKDPWGTGKRKD